MHIPNGCLTNEVCWTATALAAGATGMFVAVRKRSKHAIPWQQFGLVGAGIFAAQMINFPVPGGTSGHLLGGALAGIVLGPLGGLLCIGAVLTLQCVLLGDGGATALGANYLNMSVLGVVIGWAVDRYLRRVGINHSTAAGVSGGISVMVAALACGIELAVSQSSGVPVESLVSAHWLVAVIEGTMTAAAVQLLGRAENCAKRQSSVSLGSYAIIVAAIGAVLLIGMQAASTTPDALELYLDSQGPSAAEMTGDWPAEVLGLMGCGALALAGGWLGRGQPRQR